MKAKRKSDIPGNSSAKSLLAGNWDDKRLYSGTRAELIAAELARDGDFPGDPGGPIYSRMIKRDDRRMHVSIHSRMATPITFWLIVFKTPLSQEKSTRKQCEENLEAERRDERRRRAEEAQRRADADLAKLPSSAAEYVDRVTNALHVAVTQARRGLVGQGCAFGLIRDDCIVDGYRIDADSLSAFDEAIDEAVAAIRSARVIADKSSRNAAVTAIRGEAVKKDAEFHSFMDGIAPRHSNLRNG